jgi:hypothetical protein
MDPLLSILVPTYSRRRNLEQLLPVLVPQVRANPEVTLLISNNASPDDTAEYLRRWEDEQRVRIFHQSCNLGANIHVAWLYGQATSPFLWLVGDDDLMEADTVQTLVAKIKAQPDLGWIHLPGIHELRDGLPPIYTRCPQTDQRVNRGSELFAPYINYIGWMTSNVIRTEPLQKRLPAQTFTTAWWPQDLLMGSIGDLPALVLAARNIKAGPDSTWADEASDILTSQFPRSILESCWLSKHEKRACLKQRYAQGPGYYRQLFRSDKILFLRVTSLLPVLLFSTSFFTKALGRTWKAPFSKLLPVDITGSQASITKKKGS